MTASATGQATLDPVLEGLYASRPKTLPFATSIEVRAFLVRRDRGNLLVYMVPGLARDAAAFAELGGVARHYLNHGHEAMFATDRIDAPLFVHQADRRSVESRAHVRAGFSRRHVLDDDFEVIPTPGHTPGATTFLWEGGGHRFLFTGDSLYLRDGEWSGAVLDSTDREAYVKSLELMRELDFDVLVPWAATGGQAPYAITDQADARRRIDALLERVRSGADG